MKRWCCVFVIALVALAQEPEPAIRADFNLVPVTFSATDGKGTPIRDVRRSELKLTDDQRPREITFFGQESGLPLTVGLVVDMSGSQARFYERHRADMRRDRETSETPETNLRDRPAGEGTCRETRVYVLEESDSGIVCAEQRVDQEG